MEKAGKQSDRELLIQVALMNYKLGMTQKEIASVLNLSTMQISRLLEKARREGIVRIEVNTGIATDRVLEERLKSKFDLKDAVVVKEINASDEFEMITSAAALYIDMCLRNGDVFGLAGGRTEMRIIPKLNLPAIKTKDAFKVVQLAGGFLNFTSQNPFSMIHELTSRFGAKGIFLPTPFYVPNVDTLSTLELGGLSTVKEEWANCSITVGGIGTIGTDSLLVKEGVISKDQMDYLVAQGAVGNLHGRWYDKNGDFIDCELNRYATSITPELFANINQRILVSCDQNRIAAIDAALKKKLYNVFVVTDSLAELLL